MRMGDGEDYSCSQTEAELLFEVSLRGCVSTKDLDVVVSDVVIKVNCHPKIFFFDLSHAISFDGASLVVNHDTKTLSIKVVKDAKNQGIWDDILIDSSSIPKTELFQRREASLARRYAWDSKKKEELKQTKAEKERQSIKAQMEADKRQRERLESLKEKEKKRAQEEMFSTFDELRKEKDETVTDIEKVHATTDLEPGSTIQKPKMEVKKDTHVEELLTDISALPPPRMRYTNAETKVEFTTRIFPTPLRESKIREEEEWLLRNYEKLRQQHQSGAARNPVGISFVERDPNWLMSKGVEFFSIGDYDSAYNAYSAALNQEPHMYEALLNRSAAQLKAGKVEQSYKDALQALEHLLCDGGEKDCYGKENRTQSTILQEVKDQYLNGNEQLTNRKQVILKSLVRLIVATSLSCKFKDTSEICSTLVAVNPALKNGLQKLQSHLEILARAESSKILGDKAVSSNQFDEALKYYDDALELSSQYLLPRLNKSAIYLKKKDYHNVQQECNAILDILNCNPVSIESFEQLKISAIPPLQSQLRRDIEKRAVARLAEAKKYLSNVD